MSKNNSNTAKVAAGLATLAAAAAGTYYFFGGKKAAQHRKTAKVWASKAKREIIKELGSLEKVSKASYDQTVAKVMRKYQELEASTPAEIKQLTKSLKGHWQNIEKHIKKNLALKTAKKPASRKNKSSKKK